MPEPQPHIEQVSPRPQLERIFLRKIDALIQALESRTESGRERFFGPHYRVIKERKIVDCYTVRTDIAKTAEHKIDIIAATTDQMPVAYNRVDWQRRAGAIVAQNDIMTGIRGAGFALPPLLVFFDLMQRESNQLNETIIIEAKDQHLAELRYFHEMLKQMSVWL